MKENLMVALAADSPVVDNDEDVSVANNNSATNAEISSDETIEVRGLSFTQRDVENENILFERIDEIAEKLAKDHYYTQYYAENCVMDFSQTNKIFFNMTEASSRREMAEAGIDHISDWGCCQHTVIDEEIGPDVENFITEFEEEALIAGWDADLDQDDFVSELENAIMEHLEEADESSPIDLLGSCDRAEVCFFFVPPEGYADDYQLEQGSNGNWDNLLICQGLQEVLPRLGYSLADYRAHSKNTSEERDPQSNYPQRLPIATLDQIREIVENSYSTYFNIAVYAQVPVKDLLQIDFSKPVTLSNYALCAINKSSGTFFDITINQPIVLKPADGKWVGFKDNGPYEWCGMCGSSYQAEATN